MAGGKRQQPVRYSRQPVHHTKSRWLSLPGIGIFIAVFTALALWLDKVGVSTAQISNLTLSLRLNQCDAHILDYHSIAAPFLSLYPARPEHHRPRNPLLAIRPSKPAHRELEHDRPPHRPPRTDQGRLPGYAGPDGFPRPGRVGLEQRWRGYGEHVHHTRFHHRVSFRRCCRGRVQREMLMGGWYNPWRPGT